MQTSYDINMAVAIPGMIADATPMSVESLQASEEIGLGLGVVLRSGYPQEGRLPKNNTATIVFAGDLVTSNKINASVNGVAMAEVTFASNHAATMALIVTALKAVTGVLNAVLDTTDTNSRTIIVTSTDGLNCVVTGVLVTAGSTQTTATVAQSTGDTCFGITISTFAKEMALSTLIVSYKTTETMPVIRRGKVYCVPEVNVVAGDPVYVRFIADGATKLPGQLRNDSDSGKAVLVSSAVWRSTALAGSPAIVEINRP